MQEIFLKKKSSILSFSPSHQLEYWVMSWEPPAKDGKTVMEGPDSWCRALDCSHISELNLNLTDTSKVSFVKSICFLLQDILVDFKVTVIFAYAFLLIVFVALLFHTVLNPSGHILICFRRLPSFSLHYEPILPPPLIKQFSSLSCDIISTVYQDRIFSVQWYALSLVLSSTLNNSGIGKYTWHTCGIQRYMCGFHVKRISMGLFFFFFKYSVCWLSGKEFAFQCRRCGFNPWVGKIPLRRKWQPTSVFLLGKSHGLRSLVGYSPWGCKESDRT